MIRSLRAIGLFLFFLAAQRASAEQWTEVHSPHFTVITDAGEKTGREVALRFEQVHDAFGAILQKMKVNSPIPLTIIAFRNSKEIAAHSPIYKGKPVTLGGFFLSGGDRDFIAVDLSAEDSWHAVYHEYGHLLIHSNLPPVPTWFDEGYAEYFATLRVEKKDLYFGEMTDSVAYVLRQFRWMPSAYLFSIGPGSPEYNENGDHRSLLYAQSWLVVHYLMDEKKMAEAGRFLDLVQNQHVAIPAAFQTAFGMSTEKFDKELESYFRGSGNMRYYRHAAPTGIAEGAYTAKPISAFDADASLADLDFHSRDYHEKSIGEFQAVLQKNPDNATANRGLAYAELLAGQTDASLQHIQKAVAIDPNDAQSHYIYALLLGRSVLVVTSYGKPGAPVAINGAGSAETMRAQAQAAIAIDPEFADAYELLARAQSMEGDNPAALAAFDKAIILNPQNEVYRMNLANYYLGVHDWDSAKKIFTSVVDGSNPSLANAARAQMENIDRIRENEKTNPGGFVATRQPFEDSKEPDDAPPPPAHPVPVHYVKGKLLRVDCTAVPSAQLTVDIAAKIWTFSVADRAHMVLLGAETFSCDWHDRKVAINYREHGDHQGDIVSLEIQ